LTTNLQKELGVLPLLTPSSLELVSAMCDIDEISKKAADADSFVVVVVVVV
jgi:hypothetical protein